MITPDTNGCCTNMHVYMCVMFAVGQQGGYQVQADEQQRAREDYKLGHLQTRC